MVVETKGIVLLESPNGEKGKRLVIYTKDYGKIVCFAKNVRKKNIAVATLLSYSEFRMFQNKNSYQLIEGSVIRSFDKIKLDIYDLSYAMYLLEFVDFVGKEELENPSILKLLLYGLNAIQNKNIDIEVIKSVFELKMFQILGIAPKLEDCISCGSSSVKYFCTSESGLICDKCKLFKDLIPIDAGTVDIMNYILSTKIEKLFSFDLKEEQKEKLKQILQSYVKKYIDYEFKTLKFIKSI